MRPGLRLATGHPTSSLASSPTSRLNLGVRCLLLWPQQKKKKNSTPSEGKRKRGLPEVNSQGSLSQGPQAASLLDPSLSFFPPPTKKRKFSTRGPPFPRSGHLNEGKGAPGLRTFSSWAPPSVHCEQATGSDVAHRKFFTSVSSFRAGGKFTDKKCSFTVISQFAQTTSHSLNKGSVPFVCVPKIKQNNSNIESGRSSKQSLLRKPTRHL